MFCANDIFTLALCFIKYKVQRVACLGLEVHEYIDKRTISYDETWRECENVIDTKDNK